MNASTPWSPGGPRLSRSELARTLQSIPAFSEPDARLEQVTTPAEAAATLLLDALGRGDIAGRSVVDLGSGTGRLAIGAALLGAAPVTGIEVDAEAVVVARSSSRRLGARIDWEVAEVDGSELRGATVVMNPPFGAQRRGADRPFWRSALAGRGDRAVYAFSLSDSRSFIEARAVERTARVEARRPVPWDLPRTFAHHRRASRSLSVDLWVLRRDPSEP